MFAEINKLFNNEIVNYRKVLRSPIYKQLFDATWEIANLAIVPGTADAQDDWAEHVVKNIKTNETYLVHITRVKK